MKFANDIVNNAAARPNSERREAKARYDEAYTQQRLLLRQQADHELGLLHVPLLWPPKGFLPGYNFPRLPSDGLRSRPPREGGPRLLPEPAPLSRPHRVRPQSIIYHEGSTYRVRRAILSIRDEAGVTASARLPVQAARICPACGYGHFGDQKDYERCVSCDARLDGGRAILNLYRIEQVSTQRANRITSDEEERQRQGYEMVTTLRYSEENGRRPR